MKLGRAPTMHRILVKRDETYHQHPEKPTGILGAAGETSEIEHSSTPPTVEALECLAAVVVRDLGVSC